MSKTTNQKQKTQNNNLLPENIRKKLDVKDLSKQPNHAMKMLVDNVISDLENVWSCKTTVLDESAVIPLENNYDRLYYPENNLSSSARYTHYVDDQTILRTQMTALIPDAIQNLNKENLCSEDSLIVAAGLVYRRDVKDRLHVSEPHQIDLWRVSKNVLSSDDLKEMVGLVCKSFLGDCRWRVNDASHYYTEQGLEIEVLVDNEWIEIGECGLALPQLLSDNGLDGCYGLAMGLGLDRLLMIRKKIDDIRLLRDDDVRVQKQMCDLDLYVPVSKQPAVIRDISVVVCENVSVEDITERLESGLSTDSWQLLEEVSLVSETSYDVLPVSARLKLGLKRGQKNIVVRLVMRHASLTMTGEQAKLLRNYCYMLIHESSVMELE